MNRSQIRAAVIERTRRPDKTDAINTSLDLGLLEFSQIHDFRSVKVSYSTTLLADGNSLVLPTDLFQIYQPIRMIDPSVTSNNYVVDLRDKEWVVERYPNLAQEVTGFPELCFVDGGTLYFLPPTSQDWTITFDYFRLTPALSADDSAVQLGLEAALIAWSTAEIFRSTQQWQDASQWSQVADRRLQMAINADLKRNETRKREPFTTCPPHKAGPPDYLDPFNQGRTY